MAGSFFTSVPHRLLTSPRLLTDLPAFTSPPHPCLQAPKTADLFFGHTNNIWLIKLRLGRFADDARWDDVPGVDGCPHLYGNFGRADVEAVRRYRRAEGLEWSQAIARQEEGEGKFLD